MMELYGAIGSVCVITLNDLVLTFYLFIAVSLPKFCLLLSVFAFFSSVCAVVILL